MLILIVGAPFTGKTISACTFPKPMKYFDFDHGMESIYHATDSTGKLIISDPDKIEVIKFYSEEVYNLNFKTAKEADFKLGGAPPHTKISVSIMQKYNDELKKVFDNSPKTLVIDSATTMFRVWIDALLYTNNIPALRKGDYKTLSGILFRQFIPTLHMLSTSKNIWVIVIDHEIADKDELVGTISEFPIGPSANMGRELPKEFDEVWRQRVENDKYIWRTRKHGLFVGAGSRLHLPDPIEPATYQRLEELLKKH